MRRLISRSTVLAGVALIAAGIGVGFLLEPSTPTARSGPADARGLTVAALPAPPSGFAIPKPRQLGGSRDETRWALVLHATQARAQPRLTSRIIASVAASTPEQTTNLIVVDRETTRDRTVWVHAWLAVLPDGRTGWIPRSALGGWSFVNTRLVVNRMHLSLTLYRAGVAVFHAPVGIGKPGTETPAGHFYVRDRLTSYASPEYGPLAFGTSARSPTETDWPAGGFIGIHGTNQPNLIPGQVSHGCVRLKNAAILALGRLMPVGTPVIVQ